MPKPSRLLIVDDSKTARAALRVALADDPEIEVIGEAAERETALALLRERSPDLVTMDVFLRAENGLDLAASIMQTQATPIVVITAANAKDPGLVFRALGSGVLDVCAKLPGRNHPDYEARRARLKRTLKTLARVPVVHRTATPARSATKTLRLSPPEPVRGEVDGSAHGTILLIGASTGGPPVLASLLRALPRPLPLPIAVVQHMAAGSPMGLPSG